MKQHVEEGSGSNQLLLTIEEAARRLAIGRSHIYEQMQRGGLRSVRIGRSRRILNTDLEAFIEQLLNGPDDFRLSDEVSRHRSPVKGVPSRSGRR